MERFYNRFIIATLCFTALFTSPSFAASDLESGVKDLAGKGSGFGILIFRKTL